ncbi:DMT family transporter [Candidatus Bathyarchaeota archaeon]|nr:DMT family transporter [Candidatus Bathyarchaeota archaeon]
MYGEFLALIASFCTALSSVMATKGMRDTDADTANLVLTGSQTVVLTLLLIRGLPELDLMGLFWFAIAGICASFIGRLITLKSYKEIGVSTSSAIVGTSPLVVAILAVLFLGEPLVLPVIGGALLVVGGIVLINMRGCKLSLKLDTIYLPLGGSVLFAISNILRKLGTNLLPDPVLGAQFSTLAGLVAFVAYLAATNGFVKINVNRGNAPWLVGSGVVNAVAWIALTMAISLGRVSVMTAIVYSYPLFSVILARVFLRDTENLTRYTVAGSLLIVLGVVLVSLLG